MQRRAFLQAATSAALIAAPAPSGRRLLHRTPPSLDNSLRIEWTRGTDSQVFQNVSCDGYRLVFRGSFGVLSASLKLDGIPQPARVDSETAVGPVHVTLRHQLTRVRPSGNEDTLIAEVTLRNTGSQTESGTLCFGTSTHPARSYGAERVHLPSTAGPHSALRPLGMKALLECERAAPGAAAYYLEPSRSEPEVTTTDRLLLIPLACRLNGAVPWRVSMFGSPERPWKLASTESAQGETGWLASTRVTLQPGQEVRERLFLFIHTGGADVAWEAFHRLAHVDPLRPISWLEDVKVHYYDFLSPDGPDGKRGNGYDRDAAHFREFSVGLATQHGYYPVWGDYIYPDRKTWRAMPSDAKGSVEMSIDKIGDRCRMARAGGAKAAIYLHTAGFDPMARAARRLSDSVMVGADGKRQTSFPWDGPDISAPNSAWFMSMTSPDWRRYLLEQAQWIMELIAPDAIVVDETFAGLGYDYHPDRKGPISPHMIGWVKDMRRLLRSFGPDKALLTSDACLGSFVLWADAEGGDHAYGGNLLGAEEYRRVPVRYLAALGKKPWLPCAWQVQLMWEQQMDLARKTGAAVGIGNGWIEYAGIAGMPPDFRRKALHDIATL
jgi:hypothetical protein